MRFRLDFLVALAVATGASAALAGTGTVLDTDGKPIEGARVCYVDFGSGQDMLCANTDADGAYQLMDSEPTTLQISAPGYFSEKVPARGHQATVLRRSPALLVRVFDASTGEPLDESEVWVVYPSAKKKGPFPANRSGVKIVRVLEPGQVRVIARAEGYEVSDAVDVKLEPGKESEARLEVRPSEKE